MFIFYYYFLQTNSNESLTLTCPEGLLPSIVNLVSEREGLINDIRYSGDLKSEPQWGSEIQTSLDFE